MTTDSFGRYLTPGLGDIEVAQVAIPKQHLQLKSSQGNRSGAVLLLLSNGSTPWTSACGKAKILGHHIPRVAVRYVARYKKQRELPRRIVREGFPGDPTQTVDALAEVDRLHVYENPHLWTDLDHRLSVIKAVMSGKNCVGVLASARISIRKPAGLCSSIEH